MEKKNNWEGRVWNTFTFGAMFYKGGRRFYHVTCSCGNTLEVRTDLLYKHKGTGCSKCAPPSALTHGISESKIGKVWAAMKQRCFNKLDKSYHNYGGRGITVCDEWMELKPFYDWAVNNGYKEGLSIDRTDNNKNYCPDNCAWVSRAIQNINHRRNQYFEINGERMVLTYWCRRYKIDVGTVRRRLRIGMDIVSALTKPPGSMKSNQYGLAKTN